MKVKLELFKQRFLRF